jgi:hypothetical protein
MSMDPPDSKTIARTMSSAPRPGSKFKSRAPLMPEAGRGVRSTARARATAKAGRLWWELIIECFMLASKYRS